MGFGAVNSALGNSLLLGVGVATVGVLVMARIGVDHLPLAGAGARRSIEYVVMFPQAVPRMVFGLGLLWAWLNIPIPIYGTLWLLALAYFTVLLPLGGAHPGRRGVADRQEPRGMRPGLRRLLGLPAAHRDLAVVAAGHHRGLAAAVHRQRARARRLDLPGRARMRKVIAPAIVSAWISSSTELSAALALIQSAAVFIALIVLLARGAPLFAAEIA